MTYTTANGTVIPLDFPGNKKYPALLHACRGRAELVPVLDYCVYGAALEIKNKKLNPECCNVVKLKRKHEDFLTTIPNSPSRKTLIQYFKTLNDWGLVLSEKYHRDLGVSFEGIQKAINAPQPAGGYTKNVVTSSTTLQHSEEERINVVMRELERLQHYNIELEKNVVALAQNVVELSAKVVVLSKKVEVATTLQHSLAPHQERDQSHFFDPTISITTVLPSITGVYDGELLSQHHQPSPLSPELEDEIDTAVLSEWLRSRNTPTSQRVISADEDGLVQELVWQLRDRQLTMQYPLDESTLFASLPFEENFPLAEENAPNHGGAPFSSLAPSTSSDPVQDASSFEEAAPSENDSHLSTRSKRVVNNAVENSGKDTHESSSGHALPALADEQPADSGVVPAMGTQEADERQTNGFSGHRLPGGNVRPDVLSDNALGCDSESGHPKIPSQTAKPTVASTRRHSDGIMQDDTTAPSAHNTSTNSPASNLNSSYSQRHAQNADDAQGAEDSPKPDTQPNTNIGDARGKMTQPEAASTIPTVGAENRNSQHPAQTTLDAPDATPQSSEPAQPSLFPVVEVAKGNKRGKGKQAQTPKSEKPVKPELSEEEKAAQAEEQAREQERLEKHRQVYANIVKRRGGELDGRQIGRERGAINKLLADGRTPERIDEHHRYHAEEDWHYNKLGDRKRITAWVIEQDWVTVEMILGDPEYQPRKQAPQKNGRVYSNGMASVHQSPTPGIDVQEKRKLMKMSPEERREYLTQQRAERLAQQPA